MPEPSHDNHARGSTSGISRRSLLRKGVLGAPFLLIGGLIATAVRPGARERPPRRPLLAFTSYEYAIFAAAAARLVPGDGANSDWPSADAMDVTAKVDNVIARLHPVAIRELRHLLHIFENGVAGLLWTGRPTPFTRASAAAQDARLEAWRHSRITLLRSGYQAMKRLSVAAYYSSPEVFARVGYPGPPAVPGASG